MVPDRMARRRSRADKILAIHLARQHQQRCSGEHRQTALAHRTRLPGPQAGTRPWPLRGARLARLSSSRHTVHRRLRIPDLRAADFPLRATQRASRQRNIPFPQVIDPAAPPIRPERHVPNSITSVRIAIARAISRTLPRCPCCQQIFDLKNF